MAVFYRWMSHRMEREGWVSWTHLSRAAGLHQSRLAALAAGAAPRRVLSDADLFRLARLLHVPPKHVRRLAEGAVDWIDDDVWVAVGDLPRRPSSPAVDDPSRPDRGASSDPRAARDPPPDRRRTAAIGRIKPTGEVDIEEHWHPDHGPWLPCRAGSGKGTFALKMLPFDPACGFDRWAIFRFVPRDRLPEQQDVALFLRTDADARGLFGRLTIVGDMLVLHLQDRARTALEMRRDQVAQLARVVGSWPEAGTPASRSISF